MVMVSLHAIETPRYPLKTIPPAEFFCRESF